MSIISLPVIRRRRLATLIALSLARRTMARSLPTMRARLRSAARMTAPPPPPRPRWKTGAFRLLVAVPVGASVLVGVAAGGAAAYHAFARRRILDWGATPEEATRRLPGDELLDDADVIATRAITIDAPASAIWPWLIQMGPGRGGVYTYDWIENLFGLNMHSADEIVPEWQSMEVGHTWRNPQGKGMRVEVVERERAIVLRAEDGGWVWAFVLVPEGEGTRLLSRNRFRLTGGLVSRLASTYLMEPGSLVMERKMLLGLKERAERLARERGVGEPPAAQEQSVVNGAVVPPTEPALGGSSSRIEEPELATLATVEA